MRASCPKCAAATAVLDLIDETIDKLAATQRAMLDAAGRKVIESDGEGEDRIELVESDLGRFGIVAHHERFGGEPGAIATWYATRDEARADFTELTDIGWCASEDDGGCGARVSADLLEEPGEDWPKLCPTCYARALADFKAARMEHAEPDGCDWAGTGAETSNNDEGEPTCPTCGGVVFETLGEITEPTEAKPS
jgi:hypothetical protein